MDTLYCLGNILSAKTTQMEHICVRIRIDVRVQAVIRFYFNTFFLSSNCHFVDHGFELRVIVSHSYDDDVAS